MSRKRVFRTEGPQEPKADPSLSRDERGFLWKAGGIAAATTAAATLDPELLFATTRDPLQAVDAVPVEGSEVQSDSSPGAQRRNRSAAIRHAAEKFNKRLSIPDHPDNGDEANYPNKIGSYSKGLPHNSLGEVDRDAYDALIHALNTGQPTDFENILMGCPVPADQRKLVNPMAGLAFDLEGTDSYQFGTAGSRVCQCPRSRRDDLYWMALLRDVNFLGYEASAAAQEAAADLSALSDFRGPKVAGRVTTGTLFRDDLPGCLQGPISRNSCCETPGFGGLWPARELSIGHSSRI